MIKFFRKIRQRLLTENKFSKYIIYAFGEIVLVVIGILIALSINNWNQIRKDRITEDNYLNALIVELEQSILHNKNLLQDRMGRKLNGLNLGKEYSENKIQIQDTLAFLYAVSYGGVFSGGISFGTKNVYTDLLSTGNLQLLKNDKLKKKLSEYYAELDRYEERINVHAGNFSNYMNTLRPFDPNNPKLISKYDQSEMLNAFKSNEFRHLVDLEISYAYKVDEYFNYMESDANDLILVIKRQLE